MKQYTVDELRPEDHERLKVYLDEHHAAPGMENLYWIPLDGEIADDVQRDHESCRPHYFALELLPDRLICELLVRTNYRIRCDCIRYATRKQRNWLIDVVDAIFDRLEIIT
jgi:hypothetical protein